MKKAIIGTIFFCFIILNINIGFSEAANIVRNSGFEEQEDNNALFWTASSWNQEKNASQFIVEDKISHEGSKSILIENKIENDSRFKQVIEVKSNAYYKISAWVKTENVGLGKKGANISVDGITQTSRDIVGTTEDWEYIEIFGKTNKNQNNFVLTLGLGGYGSINTGKAWFDDVRVEEQQSLPVGKTVMNLFPDDASETLTQNNNTSLKIFFISIFLVLIIAVLIIFLFPLKKIKSNALKSEQIDIDKISRKDIFIMSAMTTIYLIVALINLGTLNFPKTSWTPNNVAESFTIDLGKKTSLSRIYYNCGLGEGREPNGNFRILYQDENGEYKHYTTLEKKDIFVWKCVDVAPVKVSKLKIIADIPGAALNEIGFIEQASGKPLKDIKIIENNVSTKNAKNISNLFDEQQTIPLKPTYLNGMYFDEIYHARTAFEHLNKLDPFETTHPPLGKIFISIGIAIFGMTPLGWRLPGTIFGAAMIPLMYLFGKKIFKESFFAFIAAFLMMFDFMHFTQTRIATIDVFVTFFIILMYYYMYQYIAKKSYLLDFKESIKPLLLCGLAFGLGAASKWIAIYGAAGLALLLFQSKYWEAKDYLKIKRNKKFKKPEWVSKFVPVYTNKTFLYCLIFFILIPLAIYFLSYIPHMLAPGERHGIDIPIKNSISMYKYHSTLEATHPYQSMWWEWPLIIRPICYYLEGSVASGIVSNITAMGNPAVWWGGLAAIFAAIIMQFKKISKKIFLFSIISLFITLIAILTLPKDTFLYNIFLIAPFILLLLIFRKGEQIDIFLPTVAIVFQYIPWILIPRIAFIYHYFSIVPFIILIIVYVFKNLRDKYPGFKRIIYLYLFVVAMLFVMFYPVISGLEVSPTYTRLLKWGKHWYF